MNKLLYPNTTQVSNFILDNMQLFTDPELRILLLITRKTIGWHKETEWMRYEYLIEQTGLSRQTVAVCLKALLDNELIVRIDETGTVLSQQLKGYRKKIFYTLNKKFVDKPEKLLKNLTDKRSNQSKNLTSTSLKIRLVSNIYKTNSIKTNSLAKPISIKKDGNVDNVGDTPEPLSLSPSESSPLSGVMAARFQHLQDANTIRDYDLDPVKTEHQAYGLEAVDSLQLPSSYKARIIGACKGRPLHVIENAVEATQKKGVTLKNADERARYFFAVLAKGG